MNILSTQVSQVSYINTNANIEENSKNLNGKNNYSEFLNNTFPKNIAQSITKMAEKEDMTLLDVINLSTQIENSMADYAGGNELGRLDIHQAELLNKQQMARVNFDDFLNKELSALSNNAHETKGELKEAYQEAIDTYKILKESYTEVRSEPIYG